MLSPIDYKNSGVTHRYVCHCFFIKNKKGYFIQKIVEKKKMSFGMMKVRNSRLAKVHCERIKFKKGIDKNV